MFFTFFFSSCVLGFCYRAAGAPVTSSTPALRFTSDGKFQVAVFEDLHYGEAEDLDWGPQQDVNSTRVMSEVLDTESPQLVVLNGDLITGENTFLENSTHYVDRIVAPLVARNLKWASTYGNHDSDFNISGEGILAREHTYTNSLTQSMVNTTNSGVSNYFLPVYPADTTIQTPELLLWFFDSKGGNYFQQRTLNGTEVPRPDWVDQSVVDWFVQENARLSQLYDCAIPSLAFFHIPVNAMLAFQNQGVSSTREPGINDDVPLAQQGQGALQGDATGAVAQYGGQDIPFMKALLATKGLMATFSGHDHGDDWCFNWNSTLPGMNFSGNGLDMCFGRHSGYGGYGTWTRGSRQILLTKESLGNSVETWIRLEDGSVSGRVSLNGTYGRDEYPAVIDSSS
ncbi:MAG: hypothetical protein M1821_007273 [Bathelium mastoideum]|nr:MAG: hypothetical protein M1821_007273 [Bathelium mastoideum]